MFGHACARSLRGLGDSEGIQVGGAERRSARSPRERVVRPISARVAPEANVAKDIKEQKSQRRGGAMPVKNPFTASFGTSPRFRKLSTCLGQVVDSGCGG